MVKRKDWGEFRNDGLLWFVNMILHTFGWAIIYSFNEDETLKEVYPARVKYRGFDEAINTLGYEKISEYLKNNGEQLFKETRD